MLKILKYSLPFLLLGGLLVFKFTQPKPPLDIHSATTELAINATNLYADFEEDEISANTTYVGKVLEVSGLLSALEQDGSGGYVLNLQADSPLGQVTCNLPAKEKLAASTTKINQLLTVKGVCTGYLFDVVLDNATIVSQ